MKDIKITMFLLKDIAYAYQKAIKAFYNAGCRYLQLDDTSWGEFCSKEKEKLTKQEELM